MTGQAKAMTEPSTAQPTRTRNTDSWFTLAKFFFAAALVAAIIRVLWVEPFAIPSPSMLPNLVPGDYVAASKYAYGYSRHSLPFSPGLFSGRILERPAERGDLVVFKLPRDRQSNFIKRVIGLPGETVQMIDSQIYIDGVAVARQRLPDLMLPAAMLDNCPTAAGGAMCSVARYRETLPNGVSYETLDLVVDAPSDTTRAFEIPAGHYFMMGDNRDVSQDSRKPMSVGVGFVPAENLIGRADRVIFSFNPDIPAWKLWRWPEAWRGGRALMPLDQHDGRG
ncbi:MAG: signal peptidase I [Rhodothalassiaceae bacterium]